MKKFNIKKTKFPCKVQPKLDGMYCRANIINGLCVLYTKNSNKINSVPHINKQLEQLYKRETVDKEGELYNHDITFQEIISIVKRNSIHEKSSMIEFHSFEHLPKTKVNNEKELYKAYQEYLDFGYEGLICRSGEVTKLKPLLDSEYKVMNVLEGKGKLTNKAASFKCITQDGQLFNAKLKGRFEYLEKILINKDELIGKMATIEYQNLTDRGVPRFGVVKIIRDYE